MKKLSLFLVLFFVVGVVFAQEKGSFKDKRDGKVYKIVKIGTQIWMAENLAYKTDFGCWVYDDDNNNVKKYGYLYNYYIAKNVCPSGWHLPEDTEWMQLATYLGGKKLAGEKMKSTTYWELVEDAKYDDNKSGFEALPGGYFDYDKKIFKGLGNAGSWWSNTFNKEEKRSVMLLLTFADGGISLFLSHRNNGCSVRCVMD